MDDKHKTLGEQIEEGEQWADATIPLLDEIQSLQQEVDRLKGEVVYINQGLKLQAQLEARDRMIADGQKIMAETAVGYMKSIDNEDLDEMAVWANKSLSDYAQGEAKP